MSDAAARRLENLWRGPFGDDYIDRNRGANPLHEAFWDEICNQLQPRSVLEVGCNVGANLHWVLKHPSPRDVVGLDLNRKALGEVQRELPAVRVVEGSARQLPFKDLGFDLVFTMGVLIHQPPESLAVVMNELVRCSSRFILCGEYYAPDAVEVAYRGNVGALFKRDFGGLYQTLFPQLVLRRQGFLSREMGWDDVTYWIFEKSCDGPVRPG